jgi:hypothetical protein
MSQTALMTLAREAIGDFNALIGIQAASDTDLRRRGLDENEIATVRSGFFDRLAQAGSFDGEDWKPNGCCSG